MINCVSKPKKFSKSDQDPHQIDSDRVAVNEILSKKSQHFAVGTHVVFAGERYLVVEYRDRHVLVQDEDGGAYAIHNPYFMR